MLYYNLFTFSLEIEDRGEKEEKLRAAEERKKTVIVGDMEPLASSLPDLPMIK